MLKLSFKQTKAEFMVRVASTLLFNQLAKANTKIVSIREIRESVQYGYTDKASDAEVGPKYVRITDLKDSRINWETVPYCKCDNPDQYLIKKGDLIFARTGATNGKTHMFRETPPIAVFASYLIRVRPTKEINPEYLYFFFQSDLYWSQISSHKEGSAQPNVNGQKLSNIELPIADDEIQQAICNFLATVRARKDGSAQDLPELPYPLEEQPHIVKQVEVVTTSIGKAQSLREEVDFETEALLNAIIGKVFSNLDVNHHKPLKELTTKIGSGSTPSGGRAIYQQTGVPFIRSMNVRMRYFTWDNIAHIEPSIHKNMAGTWVKPNDVLLNITGASIGRVACAPSELVEGNVNQHVAIIRPIESLDSKYLMYWLNLLFKILSTMNKKVPPGKVSPKHKLRNLKSLFSHSTNSGASWRISIASKRGWRRCGSYSPLRGRSWTRCCLVF